MTSRFVRLALALALIGAAIPGARSVAQQAAIGRDALAEMLMSAQERAEWSGLPAGQRDAWLDAFWARLDPTPGTSDNELQRIMRRRAERADRMFADEGGWRNDRARVLVVMGLPREVERRSPAPGAPAPEIIWTYGSDAVVPEVRFRLEGDRYLLDTEVDLGPRALLASAQEELELLLASGIAAAQGLTLADGSASAPVTTDAEGTESGPDATETVAPEVRVWMEMVFGGVLREDFELQGRLDTFPAAEGTYTVLSFEVEHAALDYRTPADDTTAGTTAATAPAAGTDAEETGAEGAAEGETTGTEVTGTETTGAEAAGQEAEAATGEQAATDAQAATVDPLQEPSALELDELLASNASRATLKLFGAYLQGEPGQEDTVHAFIIPFTVPEAEADAQGDDPGTLLRSAAVTLMPGTYRLAWGVIDTKTGKAATRDDVVDIPDYGGSRLQLTRPLLVVPPHREATRPLTADEVVQGIRMGNLIFDAAIQPEFPRTGVVEVVLLAAGWHSDPAQPGKPSFEVEYRIVARAEDGTRQAIARLPVQNVDFSVLGQQIPLGQVDRIEPGGTYLIEVRVKDLVSGQQTVATTPLQIAPAAAAEIEPTGDDVRQ